MGVRQLLAARVFDESRWIEQRRELIRTQEPGTEMLVSGVLKWSEDDGIGECGIVGFIRGLFQWYTNNLGNRLGEHACGGNCGDEDFE